MAIVNAITMPIISNPENTEENKLPTTSPGNASNPPLKEEHFERPQNSQLIDERGEKYLRETASIEDYPDAQDEQDMNETIKQENKDE